MHSVCECQLRAVAGHVCQANTACSYIIITVTIASTSREHRFSCIRVFRNAKSCGISSPHQTNILIRKTTVCTKIRRVYYQRAIGDVLSPRNNLMSTAFKNWPHNMSYVVVVLRNILRTWCHVVSQFKVTLVIQNTLQHAEGLPASKLCHCGKKRYERKRREQF